MLVTPSEQQDVNIDPCIFSQHAFYANPELDPEGFIYGEMYMLTFKKDGFNDYKLFFRAYYQNEFEITLVEN